MKITLTPKVISILILGVVVIASYLINNFLAEDIASVKSHKSSTESVDDYNKRTKLEASNQVKEQSKRPHVLLTIDGRDPSAGDIIDPINLWGDYEKRTYAGKVRHGDIVTLIKREGDGVLIETKSGQRGWVTYFFIKEYKKE